jgi:hypothetical protein
VRLENASVDDPTSTANFEAQGEINYRSKNSFDLSASFTVAGAKPSIPSKLR